MKNKLLLLLLCNMIAVLGFAQSANGEGFNLKNKFKTLGTYLWVADGKICNAYLDFAEKNGVNEIYIFQDCANFETPKYTEKTKSIVSNANKRNIKIFRLISFGKIDNFDSITPKLDFQINQTIEYNRSVPDSLKLAGINFDLEMLADSTGNHAARPELYQEFADYVDSAIRKFKDKFIEHQIQIDFFIGKYDSIVNYRGEKMALFKVFVDEGERTFIQSNKKTAVEQIKYGENIVKYAKEKNKTIIYGTYTCDYPNQEEMYKQLEQMYKKMEHSHTGMQIHTLSGWYENLYSPSLECRGKKTVRACKEP